MSSPLQNESTVRRADQVDSPLALRFIPLTFDNADPDKSALELVYELFPQWQTDGHVEFVHFTEGITNTLMKATIRRAGTTKADSDRESILIRAFGEGTNTLIDRERELRAHNLLANIDLAPELLARFRNGLMYRFIAGDACTPEDLRRPEIYRLIAQRLGQWHGSLPVSALTSLPLPGQSNVAVNGTTHSPRPFPNIWTLVLQWINVLPATSEKERKRKGTLEKEYHELCAKFGNLPGLAGKDYVFSHCDLLSGNVIVSKDGDGHENSAVTNGSSQKTVNFIDYEYATPGPAAFDICNHFAEWAGLDCEYGAVPTKSQRREFLQHYVLSFRNYSNPGGNATVDLQKDVDQLCDQIDMLRGLPGFFWGTWALIQATISQIDFDYASYAELRLGEYWAWKGEFDGSRAAQGKQMSLRERRWAEE